VLLSGNPVDGFGVPARPQAQQDHPLGRALGVPFNPSALVIPTGASQTVASAAAQAQQGNVARPAAGGGQPMSCPSGDITRCTTNPNGVCTSDGNLLYVDGNWHVKSTDDIPCVSSLAETSAQIINNWKVPIWVGPFTADLLNNPNGQISNLTDPSQIRSDWGTWLFQQVQQGYQNNARLNTVLQPWVQLLPLVVGQTQWLQYDGTPLPPQYIGAIGGGTAALGAMVGPFPYPNGVPSTAGTGIKVPTKAWTAPDANGNLETFVQYADDPNTYSYYSWASWLNALSPSFGQQGYYLNPQSKAGGNFFSKNGWNPFGNPFAGSGGPGGPQLTPSLLANWGSQQLFGPWPWAKFKHPVTGDTWGFWALLAGSNACASPQGFTNIDDGHPCRGNAINGEGLWNSSTDAPFGATLQIAIAPLPQESTIDSIEQGIISVLGWIPSELSSTIGSTLAQWLENFSCSPAVQQGMLSKVPPPYSLAAAAGALAIANATKCGKVDCSQPGNLTNPQCAPTASTTAAATTPWYQQWWVIAAGVGLVAFLLLRNPESAESKA
jgi:hypothetical protein